MAEIFRMEEVIDQSLLWIKNSMLKNVISRRSLKNVHELFDVIKRKVKTYKEEQEVEEYVKSVSSTSAAGTSTATATAVTLSSTASSTGPFSPFSKDEPAFFEVGAIPVTPKEIKSLKSRAEIFLNRDVISQLPEDDRKMVLASLCLFIKMPTQTSDKYF